MTSVHDDECYDWSPSNMEIPFVNWNLWDSISRHLDNYAPKILMSYIHLTVKKLGQQILELKQKAKSDEKLLLP